MSTGRKETIWGARHINEEQEINRLISEYNKQLGVKINKLEASAIQAERSKNVQFNLDEAKEIIRKLRGVE